MLKKYILKFVAINIGNMYIQPKTKSGVRWMLQGYERVRNVEGIDSRLCPDGRVEFVLFKFRI